MNDKFTSNISLRILTAILILLYLVTGCTGNQSNDFTEKPENSKPVFVKLGFEDGRLTPAWGQALKRRESREYIDSLLTLSRPLNQQEQDWLELIESRIEYWAQIKDSLKVPFADIDINDTTYVLLGYRGVDDGFTLGYQTVCFDISALNRAYGSALDSVNTDRMDRIFAHEYTHLLHKEWVRQTGFKANTFRDSIYWWCMYEGIGMYRSMSSKWFPVNGELSETSAETFATLYPVFVDKLIALDSIPSPTDEQKRWINNKLSKGPMKQKWGALPVGVWLALEANGNDKYLQQWIDRGPDAVVPLARKYLTGDDKQRFDQRFSTEVE